LQWIGKEADDDDDEDQQSFASKGFKENQSTGHIRDLDKLNLVMIVWFLTQANFCIGQTAFKKYYSLQM
jgi:hypothetical protein